MGFGFRVELGLGPNAFEGDSVLAVRASARMECANGSCSSDYPDSSVETSLSATVLTKPSNLVRGQA